MPELTEVTTLPPESSTLTTGCGARAAPLSRCAGLGGDDQLGGRPGGHGDVRRGRRREAVTGEGQGVDGAAHAVERQAAEGGHARREGARGAARGDGAASARVDRRAGGARVDRGDHVAAGVLDLDDGLRARAAPLFSVAEGSVVMTSWVAVPVAIGDVRRGR